jgi:hypothetical protein
MMPSRVNIALSVTARGEQNKRITGTQLEEPQTELRFSRLILRAQALHSLQVVRIQEFLSEDALNSKMGNEFCCCDLRRAGPRMFSHLVEHSVFQL